MKVKIESQKMDSSINIVDEPKKKDKKLKNKKKSKATEAVSKTDTTDIAVEDSSEEKMDAASTNDETKNLKMNKKSKKNAEDEKERKEWRRRTVPVISNTFESLRPHISEETMTAIEGFGFSKLTAIQQETIPLLLAGKDVAAIAKTGSGKTLSFVIPAVERVKDLIQGTACIILSPTRELAQQTYNVVRMISANHRNLTHGIVMGGTKIEKEKALLAQGVTILVATPGRLLDHMKRTKGFKTNRLRVLVLDEADRILDAGFEKDIRQIMARLPVALRQTMQFSATTPDRLGSITRLCLTADYNTVNLISDIKQSVTAELLTQNYLVVPTFQRLLVLYKILVENKDKKVMVFLNTCDGVNFYKTVFNKLGLAVHGMHGRQGQKIRADLFEEFTKAECGLLLCTDIAARGWDIPTVHLIVQYDPPSDINEYIHRVGRAARRPGEAGQAVMLLREEERPLLDVLKKKRLELAEYEGIDMYDLPFEVQDKVNELVNTDTESGLKDMATRAYRNFLTSYLVLNPKNVYDRSTIQPKELAKNFGLKDAPHFDYARVPLNHAAKDLLGKPKPKLDKGKKAGKENQEANATSEKKAKRQTKKQNKGADGKSEQEANEKKKKSKARRKFYNELRAANKLAKKETWAAKMENKTSTTGTEPIAALKSNDGEGKVKKQLQKPEANSVKAEGKSKKRKLQEEVKKEVAVAPKKMKKETSDDAKLNKPDSPKKKEKKSKLKNKKSGVKKLNGVQ